MASGRRVGQRPDCHTFLGKFWHFQMAVSQWKLACLTPNFGILWILVSSFWLCELIVANPIIYRLVPRPSRFETRQCTGAKGNIKPGFHTAKELTQLLFHLDNGIDAGITKSTRITIFFSCACVFGATSEIEIPLRHNTSIRIFTTRD